jgi:hypothetical protein
VPQRQILEQQLAARSERCSHTSQHGKNCSEHDAPSLTEATGRSTNSTLDEVFATHRFSKLARLRLQFQLTINHHAKHASEISGEAQFGKSRNPLTKGSDHEITNAPIDGDGTAGLAASFAR